MCFLIGRIVLINRNSGNDYSKTVLRQMAYESQTIPAKRGLIYDRNGILLAYNENQYNVVIEPKNILLNNGENLDATVKALVECFDLKEKDVRETIDNLKDSYYKIIASKVSEEKKQAFDAYVEKYQAEVAEYIKKQKEDAKNAQNESAVPQEDMNIIQKVVDFFSHGESEKVEIDDPGDVVGVYFETSQKRIYPYNSMASSTIGFSNSGGGVIGLERYYDDTLKGVSGRKYGYLGDNSNVDVQTVEARDGYSLESTLDVNIQKICERVINNYDKKVGSNVTALMAMNPNTGEVLAMAHSNQFDLNDASSLKGYLPDEEIAEIDKLANSKNKEDVEEANKRKTNALVNKWRNFCVSTSYEPGSTAKVFTIAAALEENAITEDSTWYCDGVGTYGGSHIHCWERRGHHTQTLTQTLMNSCNDALMQIGSAAGIQTFAEYQSRFNIGRYTGIDLPDELDCSRQIYRADNMTSVDLATNSFGQNFYVTMVQMCSAYCSLVNGGYYYKPHLVSRIVDSEGNTVRKIDPVVVRQTVSAATSEFMKEALYQVIANGTGARVQIKGYEIGGKTGTAEKNNPGDEEETYTVSLMAVVPAYDPQLVLYAVVDEPNC
ncbi:MAG: penicillin-binding protein 2, partial [Lachnospiraceae bacterium]|nr:penicillin-binding protein 2 [Lachnospiraceae bacterium]